MTEALVDWARSNGAIISPGIKFQKFNEGYYGGIYNEQDENTADLERQHMRLPESLIITIKDAITSFNGDNGDFQEISKQTTNSNSLMKLYLCRERSKEFIPKAKFKHYIELLPSLQQINSPYSWPAEDKACLKGTNLGNSLKESLNLLVEEWWQLINLLPQELPKPQQHFVNMKFYYEYKFHEDKELYEYFHNDDIDNWTSFPNYLWASLILKSRSFPAYLIDSSLPVDAAMLLPVIDLLNHNMKADVEWGINTYKSKKYFDFKSNSAVNGQELFNNYGRKGNEELLLGYGFCIENNEADSAAVKIKIPLEMLPDLEKKGIKLPKIEDYTNSVIKDINPTKPQKEGYEQYEDGLLFFITRDNLPDNLILLFQWLSKNEWENSLSIRMKLAGLNQLRAALDQKLEIIKTIQVPTNNSINANNIRIYINSQKDIFTRAIKGIKHIEKEMLVDAQIKPNLITLKNVIKKDKRFADSLLISLGVTSYEQLIDNNFQDQTWLLYLIRCHNKKEYQEEEGNFIPDWIFDCFERITKEHKISAEEILQFQELYEGLIIPLTQTAPDVFDRGVWTVEELIYSARLLDTISFLRGKDKECIIVKP
ncbi:ribosomal lysine N-methyltransferase 1 [[Candida] jaroonii]|uniref:Ribosomal lysine N-methyltransferase 1 n=1 Tax=[Candida] jaroonii TaxID=467808 RepID=A0ACA9YBQ4_9ASCO|nr:ribosomal lysine N-methyltransferase 1 [[Candida] jaroonii]